MLLEARSLNGVHGQRRPFVARGRHTKSTIFLLRPRKARKIMCSARNFCTNFHRISSQLATGMCVVRLLSMHRHSTHKNKYNIASFIKCVLAKRECCLLPHFTARHQSDARAPVCMCVCVGLCTKIQIENLSRIENIKSFDKPYIECGYAPSLWRVCVCVCVCVALPLRCFYFLSDSVLLLTFSYNANDAAAAPPHHLLNISALKRGQVA